ncbi:MAG TPA: phage holin family protein [Brevibacterium senegalense]|uniref:Phage holin family protein n=1 Tax=Brevibacterium senegalense TaxID=1033736 RepID=A0A921SPG2_9MICO|nr:phage holin family protein [Brevibacterium senegalense]
MIFLVRILVNALALAAAVFLLPGVTISGSDSLAASIGDTPATLVAYACIALVFGIVNAFVKPIVSFVSTPLTCLTLGLFSIIVNALMLVLTAWLSEFTPFVLSIDSFFWSAVLAAIVVAVVSALLGWLLPDTRSEAVRD